ncbi:BTB/POZ domain-containing protein 1 [Grifola frondosa]|uniref:BTB/POZ domain-containing protein 1 n=1 Tax=Grifola frondosa TaxID=5627 RepID=A0A1C7MCH7_GRIFR|nr:BTB/POZ domain-containing protein 1 [Grifola frondosa]
MSLLHAHFHLRNQQAFQRLLDGFIGRGQPAQGSSSGGKSWNRPSPLSSAPTCDVNARDWLGRTVLHLAAASQDSSATEYVRLLLVHPDINVNLQDSESHWTALHRALYNGNLASAMLLLQRPDVDKSLRDLEGYTAFDLYNSTLEGTKPVDIGAEGAELFTWGSNRNSALGAHTVKHILDTRFSSIRVRDIVMSKLHTAVVTAEHWGNLRVCGFGSGGRLGPGQHTQYGFVPLTQLSHTVISVALGQDHTLAVINSGDVLSWGLNRFSQLGYVVEPSTGLTGLGRAEEPIQATPRKVAGALKNKFVIGVAACKTASACWTDEEVFTWGTNNGQLGYDKSAHPVQVQPRVVTKISKPVLSVSITDSALACLLVTQDVICIWNDSHFKVNFPAYAFPSEIAAYRPPQAHNNASIDKITSCEDTFAALSSNGELFTFTVPSPSESNVSSGKPRVAVQPQRVWALRKQTSLSAQMVRSSSARNRAIFVRSRNLKAGQAVSTKAFKFQRVPYIQRVVQVCANATGAFGALRVDYTPTPVSIVGNLIAQDLAHIQPYLHLPLRVHEQGQVEGLISSSEVTDLSVPTEIESDEEEEDISIQKDIRQMKVLCDILRRDKQSRKATNGRGIFEGVPVAYGADLMVQVQPSGLQLPVHRVMLASRCPVLGQVLAEGKTMQDDAKEIVIKVSSGKVANTKLSKIMFTGCQPMSVLILLVYLYSDEAIALWDRRVGHAIEKQLAQLKIKPAQIMAELRVLAKLLDLSALSQVLDAPVKRIPIPSMAHDMSRLFQFSQTCVGPRDPKLPLAPDIILQLADKEVFSHSVVLRARSPLFAAFFGDEDWTVKRWTSDRTILIKLTHLKWRAMEFVMRYLCCGEEIEMFDIIESVHSVDELLDLMFDIMAAANELLLDRLMLLCSTVILKRVNINNVCSILADATHFYAMPLVWSLQEYMAADMETLLESRMLDDLAPDLIKQLSTFVRQQQAQKYPISRSSRLIDKAMKTCGDWLALQDIPQVIVPAFRPGALRDSPRISPAGAGKRANRLSLVSPPGSPMIRPQIPVRPVVGAGLPTLLNDAARRARAENIVRFPETPDRSDGAARLASSSSWRAVPSVFMPVTVFPSLATPASRGAEVRPNDTMNSPALRSAPSSVPGSPRVQPHTPGRKAPTQAIGPGMGPVFTPTKNVTPSKASPSTIRRVSSGSAWTLPPVQPVVQSAASGSAMSFAAIQQLQLEQDVVPVKDRRSLREIQEEEQARKSRKILCDGGQQRKRD